MATLPDTVFLHAREHPDSPAVITWSAAAAECSTITYGQLAQHIAATQVWMQTLLPAAAQGALMAILGHNSASYLVSSLASMANGGVALHLNWRMPAAQLGPQLHRLQCRVLLVSPAFDVLGKETAATAAAMGSNVHVARLPSLAAPLLNADGGAPSQVEPTSIDGGRTAVVFFTSGSTGNPKPIPHTHDGLLWWARSYNAHLPKVFSSELPPEESGSMSFAPFFHVMGFVANTVLNISQGAPLYVLADPAQQLTPQLLLEAATDLRPATLNTVPVLVEGLCALLREGHPLAATLGKLRLLTYGGAALPSHCATVLRDHRVVSACTYGQTETAGPVMLGEVSGDINALRPIGGARFELRQREAGEEAGELLLLDLGCVSPFPKGWRVGEAGESGEARDGSLSARGPYATGDLFTTAQIGGSEWLLYACRADDVLSHTSGELTNPHPPEDCILSACHAQLKNVVMLGSGRARPALLVELRPEAEVGLTALRVSEAVAEANLRLAEYSRLRASDVWLLQPPTDPPLPVSLKGNVVRPRAEALLAEIEAEIASGSASRPAPATLVAFAPLGDLVGGSVAALDSMAVTQGAADAFIALAQNREAARYGHAFAAVLYQAVSVHWMINEGSLLPTHLSSSAGHPYWLVRLLRLGLHQVSMPLGFALVSVPDAARMLNGSTRKQLLETAWSQVVRPYALLLMWYYFLGWMGTSPSFSVMWFLEVLLALRVFRLAASAAGVGMRGFAALGLAVYFLSGLEAFDWLRRCLGPGLVPYADALGGRQEILSWSCKKPFPKEGIASLLTRYYPATFRSTVEFLIPYGFADDQLHVRFIEHLPFYCAGPIVLASVLRTHAPAPATFEPDVPHAFSWAVGLRPLRQWSRMLWAFLCASAVAHLLLSGPTALREIMHLPISGSFWGLSEPSDTGWQCSDLSQPAGRWAATCCTETNPLLRAIGLDHSRFFATLACVMAAATWLRQGGSPASRLRKCRVLLLGALPFVARLGSLRPLPYGAEWASRLVLDAARVLTTLLACGALVELMPTTPTLLSRTGLRAAAPIYFLHNLPQVQKYYAKAYIAAFSFFPFLTTPWLLPMVAPALILGGMLLATLLCEHGSGLPQAAATEVARLGSLVRSGVMRAYGASGPERCAAALHARAGPVTRVAAVVLCSLLIHSAMTPAALVEHVCGPPAVTEWMHRTSRIVDADGMDRSPATVEFVTSICHENLHKVKHFLLAYSKRLRAAGFAKARQTIYCKCRQHRECAAGLSNVGREGHTWLIHMNRSYARLADVTIFVNPGFISGDGAEGLWHKALILGQVVSSISGTLPRYAALGREALQYTFSDGVDQATPKKSDRCVEVTTGGCTGLLSPLGVASKESAASSRNGPSCSAHADLNPYCRSKHRCSMCTDFKRVLGCRECACEAQEGNCSWNGASDRKDRLTSPRLVVAQPKSFAAWACKHWNISLYTFQRCRWHWTGTFAVGAGLIRKRANSVYASVAQELAKGGREGGVAGHYMERLW